MTTATHAPSAFCKYCGAPLSADDLFCSRCGKAIIGRRQQTFSGSASLTAALMALSFGVLAFGIAGSTQIACGTSRYSCVESLLAPTGLLAATDLLLAGTVLVGLWPRPQVGRWCVAALAVLTAAASAFVAVLWAGVFASEFFRDQTNPWRNTALEIPAQVVVLVFNIGPRKMLWEGGAVVAFPEMALLLAGFVGAATALVVLAIAVARQNERLLATPQAVLWRPVPGAVTSVVVVAIVGYAIGALPIVSAQQSDRGTAIELRAAYIDLSAHVSSARQTYSAMVDVVGSQSARAALGRSSGDAYRQFDAAARSIAFPDRFGADVAALRKADAEAIAASGALGGAGDAASLLRTFNLAVLEQYAAYSTLFVALFPPQPSGSPLKSP